MSQPSNATVSIDGNKFNAMSVHVSFATHHDGVGLPMMAATQCSIECVVDMHDTVNLPFATLQKLYELSHSLTREKIKPVKIEFWQDENQADALCTYTFDGWIGSFVTSSGGAGNHLLSLSLHPTLDEKSYMNVQLGN